jgi:hypothetical protein
VHQATNAEWIRHSRYNHARQKDIHGFLGIRRSSRSHILRARVLALVTVCARRLFKGEHAELLTTSACGDGCVRAGLGRKLERARRRAARERLVGVTCPGVTSRDAEYNELRSDGLC